MDNRHQGSNGNGHNGRNGCERRKSDRLLVSLSGRLTWKDARGAIRFATIQTRDVTRDCAFVECRSGSPIPLYRLVQLQLDQSRNLPPDLPPALLRGKVLSAVYRVAPSLRSTGLPGGYLLRLLPVASSRASSRVAPPESDEVAFESIA
ncbi:MAG: hypothetical protein ACE148_01490 [Vicinamibacterales bacterium]